MINCYRCGHKTIWQNDYDSQDILDFEDIRDYDVVIVSYYYCPECDSMHEVWHRGNGSKTIMMDSL